MLDTYIFKRSCVSRSCRLSYKPYIKPSARHIPLGALSEHPGYVHRSWPVSEIRRMHSLSETREDFFAFRDLKIARFAKFGIPPSTISECMRWSAAIKCESVKPSLCSCSIPDPLLFRIIFPYHRSLAAVLPTALQETTRRLQLMLASFWPAAKQLKIEIAWRNFSKPLCVLLKV